jgi:hypothetical protein
MSYSNKITNDFIGWVGVDSTIPIVISSPLAVTGTFWQATQPVSIAAAPALVAGTAIIGQVGIDQTTIGTSDSVTVKPGMKSFRHSAARPSDQTPYTAGDVVGTVMEFTTLGLAGKSSRITGTRLEIDVNAIPTGMTSFRLQLYGVTPPSAYTDNTPWDLPNGDLTAYLGYVDMGSPVDLGSNLYVQQTGLDVDVLFAGTSLFAYLVTNGGYTPTSAAVKVCTLYALGM